jgi:2-C-methyl-D-erythritol 4-phosphate cytidylyltransferase
MMYDKENQKNIRVVALIAAGGQGKRMGTSISKQYLKIRNKPILIRTIEHFENSSFVDEVILIANEEQYILENIKEYSFSKVSKIVPGGKERQDSVYNGLKSIEDKDCLVLIHDGARPFVGADDIEKVLNQALKYDGVSLGVMVKDTIKQINDMGTVDKTLDRPRLRSVQTPQAFKYESIKAAHDRARDQNYIGTDDCSLIERLGGRVVIVEGSYKNIKITTPEDLNIAEKFMEDEI